LAAQLVRVDAADASELVSEASEKASAAQIHRWLFHALACSSDMLICELSGSCGQISMSVKFNSHQ
jgi:hypothetical protein